MLSPCLITERLTLTRSKADQAKMSLLKFKQDSSLDSSTMVRSSRINTVWLGIDVSRGIFGLFASLKLSFCCRFFPGALGAWAFTLRREAVDVVLARAEVSFNVASSLLVTVNSYYTLGPWDFHA